MKLFRNAFGVIALSGCGLISSNAVTYDLDLPAQNFSVDASGWQLSESAATSYLAKSCANTPTLCSTAAASACPMNCTGTCDLAANTCNLALEIAVHQTIDLVTQKPELKNVDAATSILAVTVDSVTYEVTANTLDYDTPALSVYVAASSVIDPAEPGAHQIGTIPLVAKGTIRAAVQLQFTEGGQDQLTVTLSNFKNPFNVIVGGALELTAGDRIPHGKLDASVTIKAHASP
ncbi:hypothetical protein BH11MYX1_BH11MYX1_46140 [soil metagenome]